jgi:hypothetical protein
LLPARLKVLTMGERFIYHSYERKRFIYHKKDIYAITP